MTREVTVAVIDTGINNDSRTDGWLAGIPETAANIDPLDVFPVTVQNGQIVRGDGLLDLSAGHGTFVTGVVEQVAPAATIRVYRAVDTEGMGTSDDVANAMTQAARDGADIINVSLGVRPWTTSRRWPSPPRWTPYATSGPAWSSWPARATWGWMSRCSRRR